MREKTEGHWLPAVKNLQSVPVAGGKQPERCLSPDKSGGKGLWARSVSYFNAGG